MKLAGFTKRNEDSQASILIDLRKDEEHLRKNLNGKWRNQLKKSENTGLRLKLGNSNELHNWIIQKYEKLMVEKSFSGPNIELYKRLYEFDKDNSIIFQAIYNNSVVAGILLSKFDSACCYEIGWNSIEGRKMNANNFLLWNAIVKMKKQGYPLFDLGGINEELTPTITKFKRGLGGDEYNLVGEWISF